MVLRRRAQSFHAACDEPLNAKTDVEPQITRIDTDYEEIAEAVLISVWWILQSVKSVQSVVEFRPITPAALESGLKTWRLDVRAEGIQKIIAYARLLAFIE